MRKILFLLILISSQSFGQQWQTTQLAIAPKPITNTAVCYTKGNVYAFGGLDSTKLFSGIHQYSYQYSIANNTWINLPNLPDTLGKIASAANAIGDVIYIAGGYHVLANGTEISSTKLHRFNTLTNSFMVDAAAIPVAIDDQVQAVWRDSLLFIITGWSNTASVPLVQVYSPVTDTWTTSNMPNTNSYKCFGGCGTIIGDTIYYFGGAGGGNNFPNTSFLRKGVINPNNPASITWSIVSLAPNMGYRSACKKSGEYLCIIGGADVTYNYNGIAYNGSGIVKPNKKCLWYHLPSGQFVVQNNLNVLEDYRGLADITDTSAIIVGGLDSSNAVSANTILLTTNLLPTSNSKFTQNNYFNILPNPMQHGFTINTDQAYQQVQLINMQGQVVYNWLGISSYFSLPNIVAAGNYFLKISGVKDVDSYQIISVEY
jgi:hypothetical protein